MNINSVGSQQLLQQLLLGNLNSGATQTTDNTLAQLGGLSTDTAEISPIGQLLSQIGSNVGAASAVNGMSSGSTLSSDEQNKIKEFFKAVLELINGTTSGSTSNAASTVNGTSSESTLSADEKNQIKEFFKTVHKAIRSGNFDAAALANSAPDSLKSLAKAQGINLEDILNYMNTRANDLKSKFGASSVNGTASGSTLSSDETNKIKEFFKSVHKAIKSGSFDAVALAQSAPDSLNSLAQAKGLSLEEILNFMYNKANELTSQSGSSAVNGISNAS